MTFITWASPRYVQEAATILAPQNRTQGRCDMYIWIVFFFAFEFLFSLGFKKKIS